MEPSSSQEFDASQVPSPSQNSLFPRMNLSESQFPLSTQEFNTSIASTSTQMLHSQEPKVHPELSVNVSDLACPSCIGYCANLKQIRRSLVKGAAEISQLRQAAADAQQLRRQVTEMEQYLAQQRKTYEVVTEQNEKLLNEKDRMQARVNIMVEELEDVRTRARESDRNAAAADDWRAKYDQVAKTLKGLNERKGEIEDKLNKMVTMNISLKEERGALDGLIKELARELSSASLLRQDLMDRITAFGITDLNELPVSAARPSGYAEPFDFARPSNLRLPSYHSPRKRGGRGRGRGRGGRTPQKDSDVPSSSSAVLAELSDDDTTPEASLAKDRRSRSSSSSTLASPTRMRLRSETQEKTPERGKKEEKIGHRMESDEEEEQSATPTAKSPQVRSLVPPSSRGRGRGRGRRERGRGGQWIDDARTNAQPLDAATIISPHKPSEVAQSSSQSATRSILGKKSRPMWEIQAGMKSAAERARELKEEAAKGTASTKPEKTAHPPSGKDILPLSGAESVVKASEAETSIPVQDPLDTLQIAPKVPVVAPRASDDGTTSAESSPVKNTSPAKRADQKSAVVATSRVRNRSSSTLRALSDDDETSREPTPAKRPRRISTSSTASRSSSIRPLSPNTAPARVISQNCDSPCLKALSPAPSVPAPILSQPLPSLQVSTATATSRELETEQSSSDAPLSPPSPRFKVIEASPTRRSRRISERVSSAIHEKQKETAMKESQEKKEEKPMLIPLAKTLPSKSKRKAPLKAEEEEYVIPTRRKTLTVKAAPIKKTMKEAETYPTPTAEERPEEEETLQIAETTQTAEREVEVSTAPVQVSIQREAVLVKKVVEISRESPNTPKILKRTAKFFAEVDDQLMIHLPSNFGEMWKVVEMPTVTPMETGDVRERDEEERELKMSIEEMVEEPRANETVEELEPLVKRTARTRKESPLKPVPKTRVAKTVETTAPVIKVAPETRAETIKKKMAAMKFEEEKEEEEESGLQIDSDYEDAPPPVKEPPKKRGRKPKSVVADTAPKTTRASKKIEISALNDEIPTRVTRATSAAKVGASEALTVKASSTTHAVKAAKKPEAVQIEENDDNKGLQMAVESDAEEEPATSSNFSTIKSPKSTKVSTKQSSAAVVTRSRKSINKHEPILGLMPIGGGGDAKGFPKTTIQARKSPIKKLQEPRKSISGAAVVNAVAAILDRVGAESDVKILERIRSLGQISSKDLAVAAYKATRSLSVGDNFEFIRGHIAKGVRMAELSEKSMMGNKERVLLEVLNQLSADSLCEDVLQLYFAGVVSLLTENETPSRADLLRNNRLAVLALALDSKRTEAERCEVAAKLFSHQLHTLSTEHFVIVILCTSILQPALVRTWLQDLTVREHRLINMHLAKETMYLSLWNFFYSALMQEEVRVETVDAERVGQWWTEEHTKTDACTSQLQFSNRLEVPELARTSIYEAATLLSQRFISVSWTPEDRFLFLQNFFAGVIDKAEALKSTTVTARERKTVTMALVEAERVISVSLNPEEPRLDELLRDFSEKMATVSMEEQDKMVLAAVQGCLNALKRFTHHEWLSIAKEPPTP